MNLSKHGIELTLDETTPVHCASYREGPMIRRLGSREINNMLKTGVFEPADTE